MIKSKNSTHKSKKRNIKRLSKNDFRKKSAKISFFGFSIPEILVTVAIIVILAILVAISYIGVARQAVVRSLQSDLVNASRQLHLDQISNSTFPSLLSQANDGQGVAASPETIYMYVIDDEDNPQEFCIAATKSDITYSITNNEPPIEGSCKSFGIAINVDAGNSNSYSGAGTTWNDTSGSENNGILNGAEYTEEAGGTISFDGINDYVDYGVLPSMSSYTFSTWIKIDSLTGGNADQQEYGFTLASTSSNFGMWLTVGGSAGTEATLRRNSSKDAGNSSTGANLNTTDWFNVVVTAKKGTTAKIYVNGAEKGSFTVNNINWAGRFYLGDYKNNKHIGFDGLISETQVYGRVLSPEEIQHYYNESRVRYGR